MKVLVAWFALMAAGAGAGSNLFVGKWLYNEQKSPKPIITYSVAAVGGNVYDVTGSGGQPLRIKADGVVIDSPLGGKVSFKKLSDRTWKMVRKDDTDMVRMYTVSNDDKTLELYDVYTLANGEKRTTTTRYSRTSPGKGILGAWRSVSMEEKNPKNGSIMELKMSGSNALTSSSAAQKHPFTYQFDGKPHLDTDEDPDAQKGMSTISTLADAHTILANTTVHGEADSTGELKLSEDGKTLTMTQKQLKSNVVFVAVFDRQ